MSHPDPDAADYEPGKVLGHAWSPSAWIDTLPANGRHYVQELVKTVGQLRRQRDAAIEALQDVKLWAGGTGAMEQDSGDRMVFKTICAAIAKAEGE